MRNHWSVFEQTPSTQESNLNFSFNIPFNCLDRQTSLQIHLEKHIYRSNLSVESCQDSSFWISAFERFLLLRDFWTFVYWCCWHTDWSVRETSKQIMSLVTKKIGIFLRKPSFLCWQRTQLMDISFDSPSTHNQSLLLSNPFNKYLTCVYTWLTMILTYNSYVLSLSLFFLLWAHVCKCHQRTLNHGSFAIYKRHTWETWKIFVCFQSWRSRDNEWYHHERNLSSLKKILDVFSTLLLFLRNGPMISRHSSREEASLLLRHRSWIPQKLCSLWFSPRQRRTTFPSVLRLLFKSQVSLPYDKNDWSGSKETPETYNLLSWRHRCLEIGKCVTPTRRRRKKTRIKISKIQDRDRNNMWSCLSHLLACFGLFFQRFYSLWTKVLSRAFKTMTFFLFDFDFVSSSSLCNLLNLFLSSTSASFLGRTRERHCLLLRELSLSMFFDSFPSGVTLGLLTPTTLGLRTLSISHWRCNFEGKDPSSFLTSVFLYKISRVNFMLI